MASQRPPPQPQAAAEAIHRASEAFEAGDFARAHTEAQRALEGDPRSVEALHYRAAALAALGRFDEAEEAYRAALAVAPDDPELLLGAAELLLSGDEEDPALSEEAFDLCARARKRATRDGDDELLLELALVEGAALNQRGASDAALVRLDEALALAPGNVEALLERGIALFELCRFDEAARALRKVADLAPEEPQTFHHLGLIAERAGDPREARRQFDRARTLAPEDFPAPVALSDAEFDATVEAAVRRLPPAVQAHLENVRIAVEPLPSEHDLLGSKPPLSPCILGVFRGTPITGRSVLGPAELPPSIALYQRNLERFARSREELVEQIGITIMHEVGHLLGLDEDDLWERGLE